MIAAMPPTFYTAPNLPAHIIIHHEGAWYAVPSTLTTPEVNWGQRRPMPAQDLRRLTPMHNGSICAKMMAPVIMAAT